MARRRRGGGDAPRGDEPSIEHIRKVANLRREATSLRQVSREVGLSPMGVSKFLAGSDPYSKSRKMWRRWFVHEAPREFGEHAPEADDMAVFLEAAVDELPPGDRRRAWNDTLDLWEATYDRAGVPHPAWLRGLRGRYRGEAG